jgi:hypothetical protein
VQHDVVLQRADRGQHRSLIAAQVGGQHLDDALGVELLDEIYGPGVDMTSFLTGVSSPVLFGAA